MKRQAYDDLLAKLLGGKLAPGELLNRRGMAAEMKMSPAPVHEAMLQLERDGFLEALPRQGTRVRTASREDVRGYLVVREALERQAARMICGEPVRRRLGELKMLARAADAAGKPDEQRARAEVAFHVALVELADCPALTREYRRVMRIGLFYRINLLMTMPSRAPSDRHLAFLKELAAATPARAERCVRRHVWSGKPDVLKASP